MVKWGEDEIEFLGRRKDGKRVYKKEELGNMRPPIFIWWYKIKRFLNVLRHFRMAMRRVRWGYQKATRGWSDRDIWSLFGFHAKIIRDTLKYYQENRMGSPVLPDKNNDKVQVPDDWHGDKTHEKWDKELDKMIKSFDRAHKIGKGELEFQSLEQWTEDYQESLIDIYGEENVLTKEEVEDMFEGMHLYIKHFFAIWD